MAHFSLSLLDLYCVFNVLHFLLLYLQKIQNKWEEEAGFSLTASSHSLQQYQYLQAFGHGRHHFL